MGLIFSLSIGVRFDTPEHRFVSACCARNVLAVTERAPPAPVKSTTNRKFGELSVWRGTSQLSRGVSRCWPSEEVAAYPAPHPVRLERARAISLTFVNSIANARNVELPCQSDETVRWLATTKVPGNCSAARRLASHRTKSLSYSRPQAPMWREGRWTAFEVVVPRISHLRSKAQSRDYPASGN